jgi:hypothetical protein
MVGRILQKEQKIDRYRERETERERERLTERDTERQRDRETDSKDTERKHSLLTGRFLPSSIFILFRFQPIGWCYPHSREAISSTSANVFWKYSHRHSQK